MRFDGTDLGTVQKTFGGSTVKKEPSPERYTPGPGGTVLRGKAIERESFGLAAERPGFRSVRRIEPEIPISPLRLPQPLFEKP
jgi:hypothetical protein